MTLLVQGTSTALNWASEQSPWIKFGIGAVVLGITVVSVGAAIVLNPYNPYPYFMAAGAICGALNGTIEASMGKGDFGDVMLSAGMGAAFGAIQPWGGIGSLAGGMSFRGLAWATGQDPSTYATAYQWGSLAGGIVGDYTGAARAAGGFLSYRATFTGLTLAGGAGVGGLIGYSYDRSSTGALHGADLGMMAGGILGGSASGLWGTERALGQNRVGGIANDIAGGLADIEYVKSLESKLYNQTRTRIVWRSREADKVGNHFDWDDKLIHLTTGRTNTPRGVLFEEIQHALDFQINPHWVVESFMGGNYRLHAGTFNRLANNPWFDLTHDEVMGFLKQADDWAIASGKYFTWEELGLRSGPGIGPPMPPKQTR